MTASQINVILSELGEKTGKITKLKGVKAFGFDTDHTCYPSPEKRWKFDSTHELVLEYLYSSETGSKLLAVYPYETLYFIKLNDEKVGD